MGGSTAGNFGNTLGSDLEATSNLLTALSLVPGVDTFADTGLQYRQIYKNFP